MKEDKNKLKAFKVEVTYGIHGTQEMPVWARNLDEALEVAEAEYGAASVGRVRPVVEVRQ